MNVPEITRIDFAILSKTIVVNKYAAGWEDRLGVAESKSHKKDEFKYEEALDWLRAHGWVVRQWPTGARAWKYGLKPVRSRGQILKLRSQMSSRPPRPELQGFMPDLAFDL